MPHFISLYISANSNWVNISAVADMEGLGAEGEVSLLPRPDVWNDQETRLHEQEGSYGWTFGKLNEIHALFKYLHSVFL